MTVSSIYYANLHRTHLQDMDQLSQAGVALEQAHGDFTQAKAALASLTILRDRAYFDLYRQSLQAARQGVERARRIAASLGMWADVTALYSLTARMDAFDGQIEDVVNAYLGEDPLGAIQAGQQLWPVADSIERDLRNASSAWLTLVTQEREAAETDTWMHLVAQGALGAFSLLVALVTAGLFDRSILRPLAQLRRAATAIAAGDLTARAPVQGPEEVVSLAQAFNDMTEALVQRNAELERRLIDLQQAQDTIWRMAYYDPLTGLPNRHLLEDRLQMAIAQARRKGQYVGVLFLDLDRFKLVNDTFGHGFGDKLLRLVGRRLAEALNGNHLLARTGGDEFAVLLPEVTREAEAEEAARRLLGAMQLPFFLDDRELYITASIGLVLFPQHGEDAQALLRNADIAMYRAKERGRNTYQTYSTFLGSGIMNRLAMESELHRALERGELVLHYQPIVDVEAGRVIGLEALVRWQHPERGLLFPDQFIPLAEETGLIVPLGEWVLSTACAQAVSWQKDGLGPLFVTVNLSPRQMRQDDELLAAVSQVLRETGLPPEQLMLEVTEGAIMVELERAVSLLLALRGLGAKVCVDDFGTGHSSLSHLKTLPVDVVKVDRTFVWDMTASQADAAIVAAVVTLARSLGLRVIAEGVETQEQALLLRSLGCHEMQGYLFSRPLPADQVAELLQRGPNLARIA
ncbi:MAG TPA: EAL domain-containing protein [Dehalococcoidia bacterium]|nr:EAL domain-containing protein [Dehalococcoidia bacterium]